MLWKFLMWSCETERQNLFHQIERLTDALPVTDILSSPFTSLLYSVHEQNSIVHTLAVYSLKIETTKAKVWLWDTQVELEFKNTI